MPNTETCSTCKGTGTKEYLVNLNGDEKETSTCHVCKGKGKNHYMTDEEEHDYKMDNDW